MVTISHLFIHDLVVKRLSPVTDGQGGVGEALTTVFTIEGRVWPVTQMDLVVAAQSQAQVSWAVVMEPGTEVKVGDVIEWDGRSLEVRVGPLRASVNIYTKVLAEEVQQGA